MFHFVVSSLTPFAWRSIEPFICFSPPAVRQKLKRWRFVLICLPNAEWQDRAVSLLSFRRGHGVCRQGNIRYEGLKRHSFLSFFLSPSTLVMNCLMSCLALLLLSWTSVAQLPFRFAVLSCSPSSRLLPVNIFSTKRHLSSRKIRSPNTIGP